MSESQRGGARPGAGRKRKEKKFETQIQQAEGMIVDKLPWLVEKAFELAEGVRVERFGLTGPVVYQEPPNLGAIKYLVDRIMGKPTDRKELTLDRPLEEMTEDELRAVLES